MKILLLFLLSLLIMGSFCKAKTQALKVNGCDHDAETFRCVKYVRNYDGDTVTFDIPGVHPLIGKNISVRIFGIDTPEIRTKDACELKAAEKAKAFVAERLTKARTITIKDLSRDKYFRILGDVEVDGVILSEELLKARLAYPYFGGTKVPQDWCNLPSFP